MTRLLRLYLLMALELLGVGWEPKRTRSLSRRLRRVLLVVLWLNSPLAPARVRRELRALERLVAVTGSAQLIMFLVSIWVSGFSRKAAAGALNFFWGKEESLAKPLKVFMGLATVEVKNSDTGVTAKDATGATGYARKELTIAEIEKAAEGETTTIEYKAEIVFAEITAGEATVVSWFLVDKGPVAEGNILMFGTCTSTTISKTQTPPKIAPKALKGELK